MGFGYQTILRDIVAIDFCMGVAMGALDVGEGTTKDGRDYNYLVSGFSDKYGPNIVSFGNWRQGKAGGMGLNANLKIGILLF